MTTVTYLGHSTVLIETGGTTLLTDPLLRRRVGHLRRVVPLPFIPSLGPEDGVLISHAHLDHFDPPSLRRLSAAVPVVVPRGWAGLARRGGLQHVREVDSGGRVAIGGVEVRATAAKHDGRRLPLGRAAEALGYVVEGPEPVYFAGDTDLFEGMRHLAPGLALALLPVSGWGRRLPPGHLDPEGAARAVKLLRPRVAVPIHWGTLAAPLSAPADAERPAREFARLVGSYAPDVDVRILLPGDSLSLRPPRR